MIRLQCAPIRFAALVLAGVVAAGCTTTSAGEPRPQDPTAGASDPTSTIEGLPPRPREITLDDVDPCALVPESDYPDLQLDEPGEADADDQGNEECAWVGTEVGYASITLNIAEGVETRLDGTYTVVGDITDPILDFGAVTYPGVDGDKTCFVSVDVADGQQLIIQANVSRSEELVPPVCEYARDFAASAMGTLLDR